MTHAIARRLSRPIATAMVAGMLCAPDIAWADNEYYYTYSQFCSQGSCSRIQSTDTTKPSSSSQRYIDAVTYTGSGGYTQASFNFVPGAPMLISDPVTGFASAEMAYTFQVKGPANTYVPVHVAAIAQVSKITATDYQGHPYVLGDEPFYDGPNDGLVNPTNFMVTGAAGFTVQPARGGGGTSQQFQSLLNFTDDYYRVPITQNAGGGGIVFDEVMLLYSNTDIRVTVGSMASFVYDPYWGTGSSNQFASVTATADPVFTILDPDFSAYSIVGVPVGAGPPSVPAVPEANTWAMMIAGFGMIGAVLRRRRRTGSADATRLLAIV